MLFHEAIFALLIPILSSTPSIVRFAFSHDVTLIEKKAIVGIQNSSTDLYTIRISINLVPEVINNSLHKPPVTRSIPHHMHVHFHSIKYGIPI